ncbi:MAG TPA: hypothetical protein VK179_15300, partial [Bacteroidales bacterium]|nr:hypothetical protein [Bacteroidales bacterium]
MRKLTLIQLFAALLFCCFISCRKEKNETDFYGNGPVSGGDYYVATWGNDTNPGTFELPWGTWQKAFETAEAGDTVYFRGGVWYPKVAAYGNNITMINPAYGNKNGVGHNGTYQNPICFFNYPGEVPILDCSQIDLSKQTFNSALDLEYANFLKFRGLTVRNVFQPSNGN